LTLGETQGRGRCLSGAREITEAVLAQLRDLDPSQRADRSAARRNRDPCLLGIAMPAHAPEQPRPVREHPRLGPRGVASAGLGRVPGRDGRVPAR
jgi:hypothetical protein